MRLTLWGLLLVYLGSVAAQGKVGAQGFFSADAKVSADAGQQHAEQNSAILSLAISTEAADSSEGPCEGDSGNAYARSSAIGDSKLLGLVLQTGGFSVSGGAGCIAPTMTASAAATLTTLESGAVYETVASNKNNANGWLQPGTFTEGPVGGTASGLTQTLERSFVLNPPIKGFVFGEERRVYWSIGAAVGSQAAPFAPTVSSGGLQFFTEPTPGSLEEFDPVRYQLPNTDLTMAAGFDLAASEIPDPAYANPFTTFRFPDVPAGADKHFTLQLGDIEVAGLAGETVNLRQYAPAGVSALSLRGDLTPFLSAANQANQPLSFGLAFAYPGIVRYTLKPVPEPSMLCLAMLGASLLAVARFPRRPRVSMASWPVPSQKAAGGGRKKRGVLGFKLGGRPPDSRLPHLPQDGGLLRQFHRQAVSHDVGREVFCLTRGGPFSMRHLPPHRSLKGVRVTRLECPLIGAADLAREKL